MQFSQKSQGGHQLFDIEMSFGDGITSPMHPAPPTSSPRQSRKHFQIIEEEDDSCVSVGGTSRAPIDVDLINKSLDNVNNFSKRRQNDKQPSVLMYEINSSGESMYTNMTLRELLNHVNVEATQIDDAAYMRSLLAAQILKEVEDSVFGGNYAASSVCDPPADAHRFQNPAEPSQRRKQSNAPPLHPSSATNRRLSDSSRNSPKAGAAASATSVEETYESIGTLRLRDLRRLDFMFNPNEERSVLIRKHAVLFAMDPIRAVVMAERLILIVPDGADSLLSILDSYMKEWVAAKEGNLNASPCTPVDTHPLSAQPHIIASNGIVSKMQVSVSSSALSNMSDGPLTPLAPVMQSVNNLLRKMSVSMGANGMYEEYSPGDVAHMNTPQDSAVRSSAFNVSDLPFEMHAYEALLTTVMAVETQEFNRVNSQVQVILNYFRSGSLLPIEVQEKMRNRKNELSVMIRRIQSARNTIHLLTEDDEDMALMNLSTLRDKPALYHLPLKPEILTKHDEMEELLESYLIDFNALESKIDLTRNQIQNAEELLSLRLDTSRNELLIANTILAILACCFGLGAFVTGVFGMNLDNTGKLQATKNVFYIVIVTSAGGMFTLFWTLHYLLGRGGVFPKKINLLRKDALHL